jgi:hypothetical protein
MVAWLHRAEAVRGLDETQRDGWRTAVGEFGASSGGREQFDSVDLQRGAGNGRARGFGECLTKA